MASFDPRHDIPDLRDRVCLVTGGNSGLGEATIAALAQHNPAKIYLAARSQEKAEAAISRIRNASATAAAANIEFLNMDLNSFESIKAAAARVLREVDRLDLLHLNGGIAMVPPATTADGYEIQFGVNYLSHALLTQLLMPLLLATTKLPNADVRIVAMSSAAHRVFGPKDGLFWEELKSGMTARSAQLLYGQSMLAKTLFAYELSKRYPQITSTSLHPGGVKTAVWDGDKNINPIFRLLILRPLVYFTGVSKEEGAKTQLWCSFSPKTENGRFYMPIGKPTGQHKLAYDDGLAEKLWAWTSEELKAHGAPGWP